MPDQLETNPARILAPLALALCAVAFFAVLFTSGGDNDNGDDRAGERRASSGKKKRRGSARVSRTTYTVKTGDTLAGIARKNRLSIERLQELNPQLDPQALVSGQKIKLRE
jgi:Tfp pilus assembly protein FimV